MSSPLAPRPMRFSVGELAGFNDVVGRGAEVEQTLTSLEGGGAVIFGDARYGIPELVRLIAASCDTSRYLVVQVSARASSFAEFCGRLTTKLTETAGRVRNVLHSLDLGVNVAGFKVAKDHVAWTIDGAIAGLVRAEPRKRLVILIEEVSELATEMELQEPDSSAQLFRLLRRLRDDFDDMTMVLSASSGLRTTVKGLLSTCSDLEHVSVGPLRLDWSGFLAHCLIIGEAIPCVDQIAVARGIALASEGVPIYIHHLARSALLHSKRHNRAVHWTEIPGLLTTALLDPEDPWQLSYYHDRIHASYGRDQAELVADVLDIYSLSDQPKSIDSVMNILRSNSSVAAGLTRRGLIRLVGLLEFDHYLRRVGTCNEFQPGIVRRAWLTHGRLES